MSFDTVDVTNKFVRSENYNTAIVLKKILVKVKNLRLYLAQWKGADLIPLRATSSESLLLLSNNIQFKLEEVLRGFSL